jgi:phosphatidylglycerol---prolipoprotein diacylglyceryl transferase
MLPFIHLGALAIPTYGLMLAIAFIVAAWLIELEFRRKNLGRNVGWDSAVIAMIFGLAGSKMNYIIEHPASLHAPIKDFFAGMTWYGGFIIGLIAVLLYWRARKVKLLQGMDATAPAIALGYAIARQGCQISGDGDYGIASNLPWAMSYPHGLVPTTIRVHPTPIYDSLFMIGVFILLWRLRRRHLAPGTMFGIYLAGYGFERFLVEFIRTNKPVFLGLTEAQFVSIAMLIVGLVMLIRRPKLAAPKTPGIPK